MTLAVMAYGVVLAIWLSGSAYFLDRGLRALGRSTRWIWAVAMAGAAVIPLLAWLPGQHPVDEGAGNGIPVELLYQMLARGELKAPWTPDGSGSLEPILLSLWILGSAVILAGLLWTSLRLHRAAGTWQRKRLGDEDVLVSDGLGPAVLGFLRPTIVLPPWALAVGEEKLEIILLHEREHQAARDPALLTLALLLVAVAPWNPALWWMARRLHLAVEGDCDRRVLERGIPLDAYGDLLLAVASGARGIRAPATALAEGGPTFLERRLLMIRSTVRRRRFGAAALAGLAGAALLALACETPTPPVQTEEEASLDAASVPTSLAEAGEGYYLVKKTGDEVENLGAVPPEKLKLIQEGSEEAPFGLVIRKEGPEAPLVRLKESMGNAGDAGLKPLVVVDGVIISDPDFLDTLDRDTIDRIEVVKGGAAEALYGARAAGGVIQIYTKH